MKKTFKIGQKEYKYKKDAIAHYRAILNAYDFGQSLNDNDFDDVIDLIDYDYLNDLAEAENSAQDAEGESDYSSDMIDDNEEDNGYDLEIEDIKIAKVQFNTKCFEVFFNDNTSCYISYLMIINNSKFTPEYLFNKACRNAVNDDIMSVKQEYFDKNSVKGQVKCQETGELSKWTDLVVGHRQPNTFSVIIDRFKEMKRIDLDAVEFTSNEENHTIFKDDNLAQEFRNYHKEKANLRIVRKECNASRTGMARVKKTSKDLTIK